jgi:hypothetical protein
MQILSFLLRSSAALIIIPALLLPRYALAGPGGEAIASFFGVPEWVQHGALKEFAAIAQTNPQAAEAARASLKYLKRDEVIVRAGAVIARGMTEEDLRAFSTFTATPLGERVRDTFREAQDLETLSTAFASYPQTDTSEFNRFLSSRAAISAVALLDSAQWRKEWRAYGEILMCRYFQNEKPYLLANVKRHGKCREY